ncbi:MAG: hypothetical protein IRZ01_08390 [Thermoflavifilum aggregans]|nr:hypothetical protein [Thermoflavifilum aggregans]
MKSSFVCFLRLMILSVLFLFVSGWLFPLFAQRAYNRGADYRTAIGLGVDFGDGATGVGISAKHFFTAHDVGEANLLFFPGNLTGLNALYEYHGYIAGAPGLKWYLGMGPQLFFDNNETDFGVRPVLGMDFKIPSAPLNMAFDWRPYIQFTHGTGSIAGRFQFAFRFAF